MSDLSTQLESLSPKQQELLKLLLEKKKKERAATQAQSIPRRPPSDRVPLSFAQQRLWFLDQLSPGNLAYNVPAAVRMSGTLDMAALERSLNIIGQRHESLRTIFGTSDGEPVQVILPELPIKVEPIDLRDVPAHAREDEIQRRATQTFQRPFDLSRGPLWRVILLQLAATEYVALLVIHHIVGDTWSIRVLIQELAMIYAAVARGRPDPLPELPIQYGDFALWQRQWLQPETIETQLAYWRERLRDAPAVIELPTDRSRPAVQSFWGAKHFVTIAHPLTDALKDLCQREGVSLFMLLLAAFKTLLYRYTGQEDIVVGTPMASRGRVELEGMIGYLVNTLVLRTDLSGNPSFCTLLQRVREVALGAFAHQDLPFERLVMELRPERDMSRNALYQVDFILQNSPPAALETSGLVLKPMSIETGTAQVDITLDLTETPEGLLGWFAYDIDLFDAQTIARMERHLQVILEAVVADPDHTIAGLPLLEPVERRQLLVDWNDTATTLPSERCFHQLFAAQAACVPDVVAVVFDAGPGTRDCGLGIADWEQAASQSPIANRQSPIPNSVFCPQHITYRELNTRANRLAQHLRSLGVGPEVRVGVSLERSPVLLIALLAVHKAGGAYVPLDPAFPQERLAFMLADSGAPVLLTTTDHRPFGSAIHNPKPALSAANGSKIQNRAVVCLDAEWHRMSELPAEPPDDRVHPENLAYVIYTSGSTGTPKGVEVPHRALVNFLNAMRCAPGLTSQDCLLSITTLSFDIAALELYLPLIVGARVALARREDTQDGVRLLDLLQHVGATVMQATPATWRLLLAAQWEGRMRLRVLCGGEALPRELAEQLLAAGTELWNLYGPTETTIWSTACAIDRRTARITIGRPIANTQIYMLDRHLNPVPIGVPGELYIGGAGVARGYLNRPDLTAERFVPNPFAGVLGDGCQVSGVESSNTQHPTPDTRLYRTGDLARWRPDGTIEYIGRTDYQVKLRGYRIEMGEIESLLRAHPDVDHAVAIVREDTPGDRRLVAYVVTSDKSQVTSEDDELLVTRHSSLVTGLRAHLQTHLPDYMLPSAFVLLAALPLTPNRKIDRKALPAPSRSRRDLEQHFVAPQTKVERELATIWADVLGLEEIGLNDSFFELGGHSLMATQVFSRIQTTFQATLPLRYIFESPTLEALARRVEVVWAAGARSDAAPISHIPHNGMTPLSFAQERLWFIHQLMPEQAAYNIPGAIRLSGSLDVALLEQCVDEIISRHEVLRSTFTTVDGQPVQVIHPPQPFKLQAHDLRALPAQQREIAALEGATADGWQPFDLEAGPLIRGQLFRLDEEEYLLEMTIHHIVYDIWSREVFIREMSTIYAARATGHPIPLAPLTIQYADFARWQREWFQGQVLEQQLDYWRGQFADTPALLSLPTDRPRGAQFTFQGRRHYLLLSEALSDAIVQLSQQSSVTLFIVLLATFKILLHRYTSQPDIVVGTPIANRHRTEVEPLIGFFVNTLAMRTDLSGNPTFLECMQRVRETALGAYAYQDLPFERLVAEIVPHRNPNVHPLFQVMFNFLTIYSTPTIDLPNLIMRIQPMHNGAAQFDLTIHSWLNERRLQIVFEYSTDLFEASTIARMGAQFQVLLEGIVADPGRRILDLPLLPSAEREQLLVEWNATDAGDPLALHVPQSFESQAQRCPDVIAVACSDQQLTYDELNRRANRMAHVLVEQGIGPDVLVALLAERSVRFVSSLLAIFKAGGVYLPLDPQHPAERLYHVLRQSQSPLVLTSTELAPLLAQALAELPPAVRPQVRLIEELLEHDAPEVDLSRPCHPHQLAYVMFTSGSTGLPKGVMVEHIGMYNHMMAKIADLGISQDDVVAQNGPQCFDIFVWQALAPLLLGGRVQILPDAIALDPAALLNEVDRCRISILQLVPSLLRAFVQEVDARGAMRPELPLLRWVVPTGDALPTELCRQWLQRYPSIPLLNTYGSTECSDDQCHYLVEQILLTEYVPPIMSIGRPIRNMRVYVLDRALSPVPIGVLGELYIGGIGVGRGYVGDPQRTADIFIPDPFGSTPGARLYATRDTVRYLPNGSIEFIGRSDHLVKIHGVRIELGEIEAVLDQHPAVRDVVVVAHEDTPGARRLVAYVVPVDDYRPSTTDQREADEHATDSSLVAHHSSPHPQSQLPEVLRAYLRGRLPDYMLPAVIVLMEMLPLNSNGKIDRKALPVPDQEADPQRAYVAPRTPVEEALAAIIADLLNRERVGAYDDFFELGGHSLLATQVLSRVQLAFAVQLPLRALFEHSSVSSLAETITLARWALERQRAPVAVAGEAEEGEV